MLFIGLDIIALSKNQLVSRFSAFNAQTMEELSWSPVSFGQFLPAMSPDGSRLFVLAGENIGAKNGSNMLYAVDPEFL